MPTAAAPSSAVADQVVFRIAVMAITVADEA
jgi:hypothetical protein